MERELKDRGLRTWTEAASVPDDRRIVKGESIQANSPLGEYGR